MNIPSIPASRALAALLVASVFASGCSVLGQPAPDRSRYFVLPSTALPAAAEAPAAALLPGVHFGLGPVKMPGYLESQALVVTAAGGRVTYLPNAFWAEPLAPGFARALLYRTEARLGTANGVAYPWYSTTRVDWKVPVDVLRFEATTDGRVVLVARWSVQRSADSASVGGAESVFEESAGSDPDEVVAALSRCIDRLADAIAKDIAGPAAGGAPAASRRPAAR